VQHLKTLGCLAAVIAGIVGHENKTFTVSSQGYGHGTTPADITRPWVEKIDYSREDWAELDDQPIDLDILLRFSEPEEGNSA
jgi:hypothetical protein